MSVGRWLVTWKVGGVQHEHIALDWPAAQRTAAVVQESRPGLAVKVTPLPPAGVTPS